MEMKKEPKENALSVEDRMEIMDLMARYHRASDAQDAEGLVELFTEDGALEHGSVLRGHAELREGLPRIMDETKKHHVGVNHVITGDGGTAKVLSTLLIIEAEVSPGIVATSQLLDEVRRVDSRWLVARHSVKVDPSYKAPLPS